MRIYAVLTPSDEVLDDLGQAVAAVPASRIPWTDRAMWSVTLARFGNQGLPELTIIRDTLSEIGSYCPHLNLRFTGADAVPDDRRAEELSVGITGDVDGLASLVRAIPSMVQRHGLLLDRRSFQPVMPVAHASQDLFDATPGLDALHSYEGPYWTSVEMRLVRLIPRGHDGRGGGELEDVARYPFTASEPTDQAESHQPR